MATSVTRRTTLNRRSSSLLAALALAACGPQGAAGRKAAALQAQAHSERLQAAKTQAVAAAATAKALSVTAAGDKAAALRAAEAALRDDGAKLDAGVQAAPDFGAQALANTARLRALIAARGQAAAASQILLDTNALDVARTRYAIGLNPLVEAGVPVDDDLRRFCGSPEAAPFAAPCAEALTAATAFEQSQVHAAVVFKAYKETVRGELASQTELVKTVGG
jgi:hypothetical protein